MHGSRVRVGVAVVDLRSQVIRLSGSRAGISSILATRQDRDRKNDQGRARGIRECQDIDRIL